MVKGKKMIDLNRGDRWPVTGGQNKDSESVGMTILYVMPVLLTLFAAMMRGL